MKGKAYIHSLKDKEHDRHVLGEAEIIKCIGANLYLAEANGVQCRAIFNFFAGFYYVNDANSVQKRVNRAQAGNQHEVAQIVSNEGHNRKYILGSEDFIDSLTWSSKQHLWQELLNSSSTNGRYWN